MAGHVEKGCTDDNKQPISMAMKNIQIFCISGYISSEPTLMFNDHNKGEKKKAKEVG